MKILKVIIISFLLLIKINGDISIADEQITPIKEALIRWLCYEAYWHRAPEIESGAIVPLEVKIEGDKFLIWSKDLKFKDLKNMEGYYWGQMSKGKVAIIRSELYPKDSTPTNQQVKYRHQFESIRIIKDTLIMPANCTPQYDPMTAHKELMINTVAGTVQKQMSETVRLGISKYPMEVTLIIADFNIDYPYTYILVEPVNKVYSVTLHDPQDYDSDEYEREGEYPFGEEYSVSKELLEKIKKHGIIRKIILTP
jgi:hypothetical protein